MYNYINGDIVLYHNKSNNNKSEYAAYYKSRSNPETNLIVFDENDGFKYSYCDVEDIIGRVMHSDIITGNDVALLCIYDHVKKNLNIDGLMYGYSDKTEYIARGNKIQNKQYILTWESMIYYKYVGLAL